MYLILDDYQKVVIPCYLCQDKMIRRDRVAWVLDR